MNLSAEIIVREDLHNLEQLFAAEEKVFKNQRAGYEVVKEKNKIVFKVKASDSSALRAVLNSITKMISVYETSKSMICGAQKQSFGHSKIKDFCCSKK